MQSELLVKATADIAAAFLSLSAVQRAELPNLLREIYNALAALPVASGGTCRNEKLVKETNTDTHSNDIVHAFASDAAPEAANLIPEESPDVVDLSLKRPAVPIETSISDDFIISLEDGGRYRSLRRHLMAKYGMTPDDYRQKWNLPPDYPMVAPSYARERSAVAKRSGLGKTHHKLDRQRARSRAKTTGRTS